MQGFEPPDLEQSDELGELFDLENGGSSLLKSGSFSDTGCEAGFEGACGHASGWTPNPLPLASAAGMAGRSHTTKSGEPSLRLGEIEEE